MREKEIAKRFLKGKGITDAEFAKRIGKARVTVTGALNRNAKTSSVRMQFFLEVLDATRHELEIIDKNSLVKSAMVTPPEEHIRLAMQSRGISQEKLAKLAGYGHQTNVSGHLNKAKSMQVATFTRLLDAMDYEAVVVDRDTGEVFAKIDPPEYTPSEAKDD